MNCPLCGYKKTVQVWKAPYSVLQCQKCQLFFHAKYYSPDELKKFYSLKYCFGGRGGAIAVSSTEKRVFTEESYKEFLRRSLRKKFIPLIATFEPPKDVLEIGADAGGASFHMKEKGFNVEAVEICKEYAKRMENGGIKVYTDFFENVKFTKKYDVIVALEVIEHFSKPLLCINKIYDLLNDGGSFIFETPIAPEGLVKSATYGIQEAHYCVFNPVSLKVLFQKFSKVPEFLHGTLVYEVIK